MVYQFVLSRALGFLRVSIMQEQNHAIITAIFFGGVALHDAVLVLDDYSSSLFLHIPFNPLDIYWFAQFRLWAHSHTDRLLKFQWAWLKGVGQLVESVLDASLERDAALWNDLVGLIQELEVAFKKVLSEFPLMMQVPFQEQLVQLLSAVVQLFGFF